ncbi:pilus assembly protein [Sphingomonas sp. Leaf37]|uniref:pilus assembly protein n=1 Tax=Sphingomonas sp. Leaf37 TaxID=2876552 RepID=UPI001E3DFDEC|nr:pilus assembly protein [Sphingomonas sp. Leaf37]
MMPVILRRLKVEAHGLALTEFAFALPLVLVLLLYGLETANLGLATLRVHQIAATAADNAARVRDSISEDDVNEVLVGGKTVGERIDFAERGRIILSDVLTNGLTGTNAGQKILWQRCAGALNVPQSQPLYGIEGKGATDNSLQAMGKPGRQIAPSPTSAMVFAEVTYRYKPVVSATLLGTPILRSEASFIVRERQSETLTTSPATPISRCSTF